jgi:hypothetical protein
MVLEVQMLSSVDVFISYSRGDFEWAQRIVSTLESYELKAWWDDRINLSGRWNEEIVQNLHLARSVLVVWSERSLKSEWVNREADLALSQNKLIQLRIDNILLSENFSPIQAADLFTWERNTLPKGIRRVINEIAVWSGKSPPLNEYDHIRGLKISSAKVGKFQDEKKHREGYFPRLDGPLYADFWQMMRAQAELEESGQHDNDRHKETIKLYDELHRGSRHNLSEERYYELVEYLSEDRRGTSARPSPSPPPSTRR